MTTRFDFRLDEQTLCDIARQFVARLEDGLASEGRELKCLPTYVSVDEQAPSGQSFVLDLGGSNLRASYVDLDSGEISPPKSLLMPWQRGISFEKFNYLDEQAKLLNELEQKNIAPLGYCFSYPAASELNGDARLVRWTKGVVVPNTEGELVGEDLLQHLEQFYQRKLEGVAVVNDTVTSLLAGLTLGRADAYAGLIVGTGMNLAGLIPVEKITKLEGEFANAFSASNLLPVNFESGNYSPIGLSVYDEQLDKSSENPGEQRFEKAVSGMYLGRIFSFANSDLSFDPESGARGIVELINSDTTDEISNSALSLYERSAQLVSAQIAGLALFYSRYSDLKTFRVVAEGGLANSSIDEQRSYRNYLQRYTDQLNQQLGIHSLNVEYARVENANLIGAAVAATKVCNDF